MMLALLLAALSGLLMAFQGSLNTALGKAVGLLEGTFVVHIVGSVLALGLILIGLGQGNLGDLAHAPWYTYLGGVLSVGIIYLVASAMSKVGVARHDRHHSWASLHRCFSRSLRVVWS